MKVNLFGICIEVLRFSFNESQFIWNMYLSFAII